MTESSGYSYVASWPLTDDEMMKRLFIRLMSRAGVISVPVASLAGEAEGESMACLTRGVTVRAWPQKQSSDF